MPHTIPPIPLAEQTETVKLLLRIIEQQQAMLAKQEEEIELLKEEIKRLKGHKGKPKVKPSQMNGKEKKGSEKLKNPSVISKKKPQYKVINWTECNKGLKRRRELSLYCPYGELKPQFINKTPYTLGILGRQVTYKQPYIELVYMFYRLFGWEMRQIIGFFEDFWRKRSLIFPFPALVI